MTPREQLLKMQRIILRELKASVQRLQGEYSAELDRYYQAYKREFRTYQKISDKKELLAAIRQADVVFGGDFHPFAQSQRTHLRLLRELVKSKRPMRLLVEAVDAAFQPHLDAYLDGHLDERAFLKKIDYSKSWGFPWENYKIIFEFAKTHGIPIHGINCAKVDGAVGDLGRRDRFSAGLIASVRREHPADLLYVIYGDLQLAGSHLPKLTKSSLGKRDGTRFITIFQNSETLYWRLAKRGLEERVDVLKLRRDAYCVVNSPPWMKWQAYLNFLEKHFESEDDENDSIDYNDHLSGVIRMIQRVWNVEGQFTDFHIFLHGDGGVASHLTKHLPRKDLMRVLSMMKQGRSVFIPYPPTFYLRHFEVNHAAALAGQYLHAKLRRERHLHLNVPQDLTAMIWIEAVGFFASKIMNSRRKFATIKDLPSDQTVTVLVMEQRLLEQLALKTSQTLRQVKRHRSRRTQDYIEAAQIIGALLGNKIYTAFHSGDLDFDTLHCWLRTPVVAGSGFTRFYLGILNALKNVTVVERSKNERL